jgi:hypothetical protein
MIRTFPICPAHRHRHRESLRTIVLRLQRELERESETRPARHIAFPAPLRVARRTF